MTNHGMVVYDSGVDYDAIAVVGSIPPFVLTLFNSIYYGDITKQVAFKIPLNRLDWDEARKANEPFLQLAPWLDCLIQLNSERMERLKDTEASLQDQAASEL